MILSIIISLASKVFGALLLILKMLLKLIIAFFKGIAFLFKKLIGFLNDKVNSKGGSKCQKE